jgi:hypothetical protein
MTEKTRKQLIIWFEFIGYTVLLGIFLLVCQAPVPYNYWLIGLVVAVTVWHSQLNVEFDHADTWNDR